MELHQKLRLEFPALVNRRGSLFIVNNAQHFAQMTLGKLKEKFEKSSKD